MKAIETMGGKHFCVSYARPDDLQRCLRLGQSLMLDNGAFSAKTRGLPLTFMGFMNGLNRCWVIHIGRLCQM